MSTVAETKEEVSYLEMSDEDLMNVDPSTLGNEPVAEEVVSETEGADEAVAESEAPEVEAADVEDEAEEDKPEVNEVVEKAPTAEKPKVETKEEDSFDYKSAYEKLLTPFKANGRDIAIKSVDDAISLMQMGANYNKKMAALKPNLKLMKLLENNGLLNEEKLSYLIDLEKKNPNAINKLVKDSGIDPLELNTEKASEYTPNTYRVDDREIELDSVLDEIQGTPTYARTLDIVSTKWDGASKQVIAGSPQLLKVINAHVQSGIYDTISKEVESERMFGRLDGLSDIEAYRKVGDAIQARGGFGSVNAPGNPAPNKPVVVTPKSKVNEDLLRDKKRAASSTKPAVSSAIPKDFNPLALSDEEFSKVVNPKFL